MTPEFSVKSAPEPPWTVITVSGEVDLATAPQLEDAIEAADGYVAIDLSKVEFMDSSGLRVLISANTRADEDHLALLAPSEAVTRLLEVAGLSSVFTVHRELPDGGPPDTGVPATGS